MKKDFLRKGVAILALAFIPLVSCSDDDNDTMPQNNTIAAIASSNANLSILVDALDRAGLTATLDGTGSFTVFAPTNQAFTAFLQQKGFANLEAVPVPVLKEILLNHVVSGTATSSSLATGYVKTLAKGSASSTNTLSMFINTANGVVINGGASNGGATVTTADVMASNGVVHIVGNVIDLPTVTSHAIANPDFSILVQALTRDDQPDFAGILSGSQSAPFTVFAPSNAAFASLLTELNLSGLAQIPQATLENTLKYHVVAGQNVLAASLMDNMTVNTFQGGSFTVNLEGGASITDANGRVSTITATDVQASNGVVHVINKVLLPPM
ncbi:fasciclin domain-containing protein [Flavobacterium suzhouense]|uniref:Fasciclin domain-containing protein n=1 Tax=Flavobacterium suzhouense TaxID=1529638 RepID=A0ABW5NXY1_9FLAO